MFGAAAYAIWGLLPLYFALLSPAGPVEISAWRIVFSIPVAALILTMSARWHGVTAVLADRRTLLTLAVGALLLVTNWLLFVVAATSGHVVDAALGYFINPIMMVLLGVVLLRERLGPLQWIAVAVATAAMCQLTVAMGAVPWIGIGLAVTFALYGLTKQRTARVVDAPVSFAVEAVVLVPLAVLGLLLVASGVPAVDSSGQGIVLGTAGVGHTVAVALSGVVTAAPLLLFAAASRRLPLSHMGLLQFVTPVLQFLTGFLLLHEPMPPERWWGFGLVWVALALVVIDLLRDARRARSAA